MVLVWMAYAIFFAAGKQLSGTGGSVLYWATGNARFGAPPPSSSSGSGGGGGGTGAANAPTKANPGTPFPAPRR